MKLTVLSVAYPLAPVRIDAVGGAEQVLAQIDRALVARKHESIVIAQEGSAVDGNLIPVPASAEDLSNDAAGEVHEAVRRAIRTVLASRHVDVIHFHGIDFWSYIPETAVPLVATLHLPPSWYPPEVFARRDLFLHCVSASQRRACPPGACLLPDIPNGVRLPTAPTEPKQDYALALGRICPEKGFHLAAEACGRAGVGFLLGGAVYPYPAHREYFENELKPRLDGVRSKFLGAVHGEQKDRLLAHARCVLVPSLAPETSSLVAMEAIAAGTPVIAFASGALPELVQNGKTGFVVHDAAEMAEAIRQAPSISPEHCRSYAAEHFSIDRMTDSYIHMFRAVARTPIRITSRPEIQMLDSFEPVREELRLVYQASTAGPFQSVDWLEPWWDAFRPGNLKLGVVRESGRIAGYGAFYEDGGIVRSVGAGITDYQDMVAVQGLERIAGESLLESIAKHSCDLDELTPESLLLHTRLVASVAVKRQDSSVCPVVSLDSWAPEPKLAKNLRYSLRRLKREGEVAFETWNADRATAFVDELVRLHEIRWEQKAEAGVLHDPKVRQFHAQAIPKLRRAGLARLHALRLNRQTIAVMYVLARGGVAHYYLGGFDPAFEPFSPGSLLIEYAIRHAQECGDREFDFLRGDEPYKRVWGAVGRRNQRLLLRPWN